MTGTPAQSTALRGQHTRRDFEARLPPVAVVGTLVALMTATLPRQDGNCHGPAI